jgi:UDP-perosamine 4-acetyltransferase
MSLPVIILGGGGHSKVLAEALQLTGTEILGFCDPHMDSGATGPCGLPVLGGDEVIADYPTGSVLLVNGIGSTTSTQQRADIYRHFVDKGYGFSGVIHSSAIVSPNCILGDGTQVLAGAIIQSGAHIGANSIVNTRASVDHDCIIGESVHIAPGATLSGNVQVGDNTHIGTGTTVIQGLSIGHHVLIAAGAVVTENISDNVRAP